MGINYELAKKEGPKLKAALTRAEKKGYSAVLAACKTAVKHWEVWGAWPDHWSHWQRALDDATFKHNRANPGGEYVELKRLEEL